MELFKAGLGLNGPSFMPLIFWAWTIIWPIAVVIALLRAFWKRKVPYNNLTGTFGRYGDALFLATVGSITAVFGISAFLAAVWFAVQGFIFIFNNV